MNIAAQSKDAWLLAPQRTPVSGWSVRPGTFRVSVPYDRPIERGATSSSSGQTDNVSQSSRKRRKLTAQSSSGGEIDSDTQWVLTAWESIKTLDGVAQYFQAIKQDHFYHNCVYAPPCEDVALDLVELQPMLKMLHSGFHNANTDNESDVDPYGTLKLDVSTTTKASELSLELGDIYETMVCNENDHPVIAAVAVAGEPHYVIPPHSAFIISDFSKIQKLVDIADRIGGFKMIMMDPPWQNASVDRMSHYGTLDLYELFKIPIPALLKEDGIVAIWITNRAKVKRVVIEKLFPAWGLTWVAHWFWLKVTTHGETVLDLKNAHRRPYEGILIGRRVQTNSFEDKQDQSSSRQANSAPTTLSKKLLVSIPSQHSRKPSIATLLSQEFLSPSEQGSEGPQTLELFARSLEEGIVSWGNEPIRFQYCGRRNDSHASSALDGEPVQDGFLVPDECYTRR
ncbi:Methyltransferase-like protein 4 [Podila epigama]|nr:Methyltransferase-like protein 4 [Podila epigama]